MNLYIVTIQTDSIGRDDYYVSAKDARGALDAGYKKCRKAMKGLDKEHMYVQTLHLMKEDW